MKIRCFSESRERPCPDFIVEGDEIKQVLGETGWWDTLVPEKNDSIEQVNFHAGEEEGELYLKFNKIALFV